MGSSNEGSNNVLESGQEGKQPGEGAEERLTLHFSV